LEGETKFRGGGGPFCLPRATVRVRRVVFTCEVRCKSRPRAAGGRGGTGGRGYNGLFVVIPGVDTSKCVTIAGEWEVGERPVFLEPPAWFESDEQLERFEKITGMSADDWKP